MRVVAQLAGVVAFAALGIATYYVLSFVVLLLVGKVLPLTGRRRR